jgi:hypothetical protein
MSEVTTVGSLLINEALPEDLRKQQHILDKKGVHKLFTELYDKHPDKYVDVLQNLSKLGQTFGWTEGVSVSLAGLRNPAGKEAVLSPVKAKIKQLLADDTLNDEDRKNAIINELLPAISKVQDNALEDSVANNSPFAHQVVSGARGKKSDISSLRGADLLTADQRDRLLPIPLTRSYSEGYTPAQYFAASYGQRKNMLATKIATADAGFLCFAGETLILMADCSVKPIKDIQVGDRVMSSTITGECCTAAVTKTFNNGVQKTYEYSIKNSFLELGHTSVRCTPNHNILCTINNVNTKKPIDFVFTNKLTCYAVSKSFVITGKAAEQDVRVYDFEVDHPDHLYVLANGMVVSNSKQLSNSVHRQVITKDRPDATRLPVGFPVNATEKDNIGAVLAKDVDGIPAGTVLTPKHIDQFKDNEIDEILIHSPITEITEDGGLSAWSVGKRTRRGLHQIGDAAGLQAAQAIGEKLCLAAGTEVRMADGSIKKIEDIVPGELVIGCSEQGVTEPVKVLRTFCNGIQECNAYLFTNGYIRTTVICTDRHRFLVDNKVMEIGLVTSASKVNLIHTEIKDYYTLIDSTPIIPIVCYDLEIDHPSHLYVLANHMVTHNSQGMLSSKHGNAVKTRQSKAGFEYLNRLIQAPDHFPEAGPLAEVDGIVTDIKKAPQGGHIITVGKHTHYVHQDLNPTVKVGDTLDAGDELSDGVPHPKDLVRLKGLGEARRIYTKNLQEALANSGIEANRRNVESLASGILNWATVTNPDGIGEHVCEDIVPVGKLVSAYKPRADAVETDVKQSIGKYLDEPALHYTPGTRITKKVAEHLNKWGIPKAYVHRNRPDFEPTMVRGLLSVYHDPDWQTRLAGFYTASAFQKSLHRGLASDTSSTSFVPALAEGSVLGSKLTSLGKYGQVQSLGKDT